MQPVPAQRIVFTPAEQSEDMRPSRSRLALLLSLTLLAGLVGCGQTSSDKAPSLESRASVGGPPLSKQGPSPGNNPLTPVTPAASPVPLASGDKPGIPSGQETVLERDFGQGGKLTLKPESAPNGEIDGEDKLPVLDIPESIAKGLDSPDAHERLQAMNHWEVKGAKAPLAPLFAALDDEDGRVREKATEIIERYYAIEQEQGRTE